MAQTPINWDDTEHGMHTNRISTLVVGGNTYYLKDVDARAIINSLDARVDDLEGAQFIAQVYDTLPTASADTLHILGLVAEQGATGTYVEYVTVRSGAGTTQEPYTYAWEQIGSTEMDLSGYVKNVAYTDATHTLTQTKGDTTTDVHTFGALADKSSASGTVAAQTVAIDNGTVTASGAIAVTLKDGAETAASVSGATYTPAGDVTVTGNVVTAATLVSASAGDTDRMQIGGVNTPPTLDIELSTSTKTFVTAAISEATWTGSDYTAPTATLASLTYSAAATDTFAQSGVTASVSDETLTFSAAATAAAVTSAQEVTSWNAGAFNAGSLSFGTFGTKAATTGDVTFATAVSSATATAPEFTGSYYKVSAVTGANALTASFAGASATITPDVKYTKQAVDTATFTGSAATVTGSVTFSATSVTVS